MEKFKQKYIEEAYDIISELEESILQLEDNTDISVVEEVFRSMHTLKGGGAMFGFDKIRDVTHELENIYDLIRSGKKGVTKPLLDITLEAVDYFKYLLGDTEDNSKGQSYHEGLLEKICNILNDQAAQSEPKQTTTSEKETATSQSTGETPKQPQEQAQTTASPANKAGQEDNSRETNPTEASGSNGLATYHIIFQPHKDILKNGTDPLLLIEELSEIGEMRVFASCNTIPDLDELDVEELHICWNIILATENKDAISDVFIFIEEDSNIQVTRLEDGNLLENAAFSNNLTQVFSENGSNGLVELQNLIPSAPEKEAAPENHAQQETKNILDQAVNDFKATIDSEKGDDQSEAEEDEIIELAEKNGAAGKAGAHDTKGNKGFVVTNGQDSQCNGQRKQNKISSIRIAADKVDEFMNLVSELVTTQARLSLHAEKDANPELIAITETIQKLSGQLRDNAFDMSLIPLQSIMTRFQRMVRDLSSELGKDVVFRTEGTETELDKSIIENLSDPLLHILRNSIDHGIEDAKTREKAGKPKKGQILLKAYYSGAHVHIEISDDGKGMDPDNIRKKAIEKGLISPEAYLTRKEIFDLIFVPGFSTTSEVTDISGRGVGMNVVKEKISEIRGDVEVDSVAGRGTTITIKLPLTLSIIDGLLLYIGDTRFIVPLNVVNKIYSIKHSQLSESYYNVIVLSGEQIPYYNLKKEFNIANDVEDEQVVVVSYDDKKVGIVVDKVVGEYQAVLKPLGKHYRKLQIISGGTILGDGSVALVLDTNKIIHEFSNAQKPEVNYAK